MTWSYSRISTFDTCPYKFYLKYIEPQTSRPMFFSEYGSFMHQLLEQLYSGKITSQQAQYTYVTRFASSVAGRSPSDNVFADYFKQGLECLKSFEAPNGTVLDTERFVRFKIDDLSFIGYIDMLLKTDSGYEIWDHKSHNLKPRSKRKTPTKTDAELDEYLRQLYLYSIPATHELGCEPINLVFNCYRTHVVVSDPFSQKKQEEAKQWASSCVGRIIDESDWNPNLDFFRCRHLCEVNHCCEYYEMSGGMPI